MSNIYRKDPFWTRKRLTPGQLQAFEVSLSEKESRSGPRLEIDEILSGSIFPEEGFGTAAKLQDKWLATLDDINALGFMTRQEEQEVLDLQNEYGWMSELRLQGENRDNIDCRWIHVSNKFRTNLTGVFVGMSDWSVNGSQKLEAFRELQSGIRDQDRFSKHGKIFDPFFLPLNTATCQSDCQLFASVPFLDWTIHPDIDEPPLRFQVDERDTYYSSLSAAHPLRSLLQYYYRLEDTSEREQKQVFARHRPWYTDRNIDLRVRRWYGHYPASVLVDELWVLVIDERHIVTFSSNQSWKSRWPPLQLPSRIFEISFRDMRDRFRNRNHPVKYSAVFHSIACLHGAIGLMHRSFWTDMPLPCTERYGGYLSHLQYRIYRAPSTRLVMELLQAQDELNIIQYVTQQQLDVLEDFRHHLHDLFSSLESDGSDLVPADRKPTLGLSPAPTLTNFDPTLKRVRTPVSVPPSNKSLNLALDSLNATYNKLSLEQGDITSLKNSSNDLLTRTIQLVNIRTESHNQAILVFTIITVIFLPLSFMASFFGMNTSDIRNLRSGQWVFWASAVSLTTAVVVLSIVIAFYGPQIGEALSNLKAGHISHQKEWMARLPFVAKKEQRKKHRTRAQMMNARSEAVNLDSSKADSSSRS